MWRTDQIEFTVKTASYNMTLLISLSHRSYLDHFESVNASRVLDQVVRQASFSGVFQAHQGKCETLREREGRVNSRGFCAPPFAHFNPRAFLALATRLPTHAWKTHAHTCKQNTLNFLPRWTIRPFMVIFRGNTSKRKVHLSHSRGTGYL